MPKITLDRDMFKALASETRLDILKTLDGKKLGLNEISNAINLNKATLHEHLSKLNEAGLVKRKEREGHKWVYYKLTWKGESLLHPENTRIVVMFSATFIALFFGFVNLVNFFRSTLFIERRSGLIFSPNTTQTEDNILLIGKGSSYLAENNVYNSIALVCFSIFFILMIISIWRYKKNKISKL
jgi:DNA-binding transcriptional ArsR family regulator